MNFFFHSWLLLFRPKWFSKMKASGVRTSSKQCVSPWLKDWSIFNILRGQYKDYPTLKRKLNLSKTLSEIAYIENVLSEQLSSVAMIVTKSPIGINELVKNLTEKKSQILIFVKTLLQLQNKVNAKKLSIL